LAASHANAKAEAARQQIYERAQQTDYASKLDMSAEAYVKAPTPPPQAATGLLCASCGTSVGKAKFCPECGTPTQPPKPTCTACGHQPEGTPKFCPECGNKM
jgi:membrane protease subunit (stomatin/prohibitin family)